MENRKRSMRAAASWAFALALSVATAHSQPVQWRPEKNVEIVAGVSPGGAQDRTARQVQRIIQEKRLINTSSSVVNKPGGGGTISLVYMNQHAGDGHYLLISSVPLLANHITGRSPLSHRDFTPIAQLFSEYVSLTVNADSPLRTANDVVSRLKNDPTSLSISVGTTYGNQNHIAIANMYKTTGGDPRRLKVVVFNSTGDAVSALLGGHVDAVSSPPSNVAPYVEAGKLRMLAISSPQRLPGKFANCPTWKELGLNVVVASDRGVMGPKGMTKAQVSYWEDVVAKLTSSEDWKEDLERNMWVGNFKRSNEAATYLESTYIALKSVLDELGLSKQVDATSRNNKPGIFR